MADRALNDPRRVAFRVLREVDDAGAYANLALSAALSRVRMSARDAALATELVAGTLRWRGAYVPILESLSRGRLDDEVRDILLIGTHQILMMRVPAHAAVSTSVALARVEVGHRVTGLVNAILRRVASRLFAEWHDHLKSDRVVRFSHPAWMIEAFEEVLGADPEPLLTANNMPPRVCVVARPGLCEVDELLALDGATPHPASPSGIELKSGDPGLIPAVREGRAGVQDAGSQVVALALAAAPVSGNDARWLDVCAGPGGKAALLACLAAPKGAFLLANERAEHRARLVESALRAVPSGVAGVVVGDGTQPAWNAPFDRVVVDAPCSGLGALRRRPESRWRKQLADLEDLVPLQRALLTQAIECTRPGGVIGYATCSPMLQETVGIVEWVLKERFDVAVIDTPPLVPWLSDVRHRIMPETVQLWPHLHGTDAMFLALLRRM